MGVVGHTPVHGVDTLPSIDTDTRLIMTILFVGAMSGVNIYFYQMVGVNFPYGGFSHAVLFGIATVGAIMIMKAIFDLFLNDVIEEFLLKRNIDGYWNRKAREEENRKRVRDSLRQFDQTFQQQNYGEIQTPFMQSVTTNDNALSPTLLTQFNE